MSNPVVCCLSKEQHGNEIEKNMENADQRRINGSQVGAAGGGHGFPWRREGSFTGSSSPHTWAFHHLPRLLLQDDPEDSPRCPGGKTPFSESPVGA